MILKKTFVVLGFAVLIFLHFDFWWFDQVHPILFGFMPIALWFQVLIGGILASIFLYFAYKVIWPDISEEDITPEYEEHPEK